MTRLPISLVLCLALAPAIHPALAADDDAGKYKCYTRAGREVPSDSFKLGKDGHYGNKQNPNQGDYATNGRSLYFNGGRLDGTAALALPDGGIKVGKYSFCYPASDKGSHAVSDR